MRKSTLALAGLLMLAGTGAVCAEESATADQTVTPPPSVAATTAPDYQAVRTELPVPVFADVRDVNANLYFEAKANNEPLREQDTLDLIKQDGHQLQLELERWSIDNSPQDVANTKLMLTGQSVDYYPTYDQLDSALNTWNAKFGNYSGKRPRDNSPGLYPNPITSTNSHFDGHAVPFGWSAEAPGNFSYLYQLDAQGHVVNYMLMFYGTRQEVGFDVTSDGISDGVIMNLVSGRHNGAAGTAWYCNGVKVFDKY